VVVVAIVALKTDLLHGHHYQGNNEYNSNTSEAVPEYEVEQLAQALNVMYIPTSSKLDVNVTSLFQRVAEEVLERRKRGVVAGMVAGDYGYSNNGQQLKKNGGLGGGGLGRRYHSSGNGSGGGNNDTTRPSSPVSSKVCMESIMKMTAKRRTAIATATITWIPTMIIVMIATHPHQ